MPGHQAPEPALRPAPRGCARQGDAQGDVQGPALSALRPGRPATGVLRPQPWAARDEDLCREAARSRGREAAEGFPMLLRAGLHKVKRMCHFYQKVALLSKNRDVGGVTRL